MKNKLINWQCLYLMLLSNFLLNIAFSQPLVVVGTWAEQGLYRPLVAVSQDRGTTWFYPPSANQQPFFDNYFSSEFSRSFCNKEICVAVGNWMDKNAVFRPMLAWSKDEGTIWNFLDMLHQGPVLPNPSYSKLYDISCTDDFCLTVGIYTDTSQRTLPLLARGEEYQSEFSWNFLTKKLQPRFPDNFYSGQFKEVSCNKKTCLVVGEYFNQERQGLPLLMRSDKTGKDWTSPALNFPSDFKAGNFRGTICNESLCFAVGDYNNGGQMQPLLMRSTDQGKTWQSATIPMPDNHREGTLAKVSCENDWCIAAGSLIEDYYSWPFLVYSKDAGQHWHYSDYVSKTGLPESFFSGELVYTACNTDLCLAAGSYTTREGSHPLLAISKDKGETWLYSSSAQKSSPLALDEDGMFLHAFCNDYLCLATGDFLDTRGNVSPLLAVSGNKEEIWHYPDYLNSDSNFPSGYQYARFFGAG